MLDTVCSTACQLCRQVSWCLYNVWIMGDEYKPHYWQARSRPVGEPITVCHSCLHSRSDLVEWYEDDPLCQQMDALQVSSPNGLDTSPHIDLEFQVQ